MQTDDGLRARLGAMTEQSLEESRIEGRTIGKYRFGSEIGRGGMGAVYLAKDTSLGRTVVIKLINFPHHGDVEHRKMMIIRFRREAQAASRVQQHPNVVSIFAFDEV